MSDVTIRYDIRVVRMAKSSRNTKLTYILDRMDGIAKKRNNKGKPENMNLCLGHFDVMMIDGVDGKETSGENPMHWMIADYNKTTDLARMLGMSSGYNRKSSEATSYFPIYMLLQLENPTMLDTSTLDFFWRLSTNYTVIMRLHRERDNRADLFRKLLLSRLEVIEDDQAQPQISYVKTVSDFYVELATNKGRNQVHCALYDSLELGDVVAVLKGDSLRTILQIQRWLYESRYVNDAYSYCGIRHSILRYPTIPPKQIDRIPNTDIDYVETRFSVRSTDIAWELFKESINKGYFVTGSSDALVHYQNITERALLQNICKLIHDTRLYDAFNAVVTRVGLENRQPPRDDKEKKVESVCKEIKLSAELINWLSNKYKQSTHPEGEIYAHSLEKLVSSLNSMHSNSVTDDLSSLMYDGIEALLEQLTYNKEHNYWYETLGETLQEFLDQWSSTTNEILHLESQLFQHPELIPVRFYIPAMILQFQQLIVKKAMGVVRKIDDSPMAEYIPIMLPKSQNSTLTKAILDPKELRDYRGRSPLCIYIPIHMLYHPYRISVILCHEIAHYCGNSIRNRSRRNEIINKCMSYYVSVRMIIEMGLMSDGLTTEERSENALILSKILLCTDQMEYYLNHLMTENMKNGYLEDVIHAYEENIGTVITDPQVLNDLVRTLQRGQSAAAQQRICDRITMEGYSAYANLVCNCQEHMKNCLDTLLRECFADVVMVLLSNCSFDDYYRCMFHDEYENLENKQYAQHEDKDAIQERFYETHTDRMALVACCINTIRPQWCNKEADDRTDLLWKRITYEKIDAWNESADQKGAAGMWKKVYPRSEHTAYALLGYEAKWILDYLNGCARSIDEKLCDSANKMGVEELRNQIQLMKSGQMDWNKLQKQLREKNARY